MTRGLGNRLFCWLVNTLFGTSYSDLCYGYNAFWAKHLASLNLDCDGFEVETVMNIRAAKAGLRIAEVPSHEHSRLYGVSNLRVLRDGWRIIKVIMRERFAKDAGRVNPVGQEAAAGHRSAAETRPEPASAAGNVRS